MQKNKKMELLSLESAETFCSASMVTPIRRNNQAPACLSPIQNVTNCFAVSTVKKKED
jgi:hypothetical protein